MKRKRYTEEKIIQILNEHENGSQVDDICRRHEIANSTF
jgi:putative transposase